MMIRKYLFCLFLCCTPFLASAQLIQDFSETTITDEIYRPVGIRFDDTGRAFVWERVGLVHVIDSSGVKLPEPLIDISEEVGSWGDHGFLGFALDPAFLQNGYFYLLYVVDRHHLLYHGTPNYVADSTISNQATIARITRYQADPTTNFTTTKTGSRKVLIGETKETGIPILIASHGVGTLAFGTDGTLLASCGDGGSFLSNDYGSDPLTYAQQALDDGIITAKEDVGSFRSQMIDVLNGKILRIDPETGDGISSNPFFDDQDPRAARSRVYALGLRNPFRFILKPNTGSHNPDDGQPGTLYIGDVGGSKWEELNICDRPGMNFGYPLFEGIFKKPAFWQVNRSNPDALNPLFENGNCNQMYFDFQELIQQPLQNQSKQFVNICDAEVKIEAGLTFLHSPPKLQYANKLSNKPERAYIPTFDTNGELDSINVSTAISPVQSIPFSGYTSIPGLFYEGDNFPEEYQGKYFHADYSFWIRAMDFDENNDLQTINPFHNNSEYVLDLALNPKDGSIYYVDFHSRIQRIIYGGNNPPVVHAKSDVVYGASPLTVNFEASDSYDPEGSPLTYLWDFGDGDTSILANPSHVFESSDSAPIAFEVELSVMDNEGAVSKHQSIISLNNTPPLVEITSFQDGDFYSVNGYSKLPLAAKVIDLEHSEEELTYAWTTLLKHNTHEHAEEPVYEVTTETIIEPIGCLDETYWYEVQLEVRDAAGLVGRDTNELFPYCGDPFFNLIQWKGYVENQQVVLEWEADQESGLALYEVQRITAVDGLRSIANVLPNGANSRYTFYDNEPVLGNNNYRLKVIRTDRSFDFTPELRILFPAKPAINLYPNPSISMITFEVQNVVDRMELEIYSTAGQKVLESTQDASIFTLDIANLAAGIYTYRLKNGATILSGKFVKLP